jgi:hypothetical protein
VGIEAGPLLRREAKYCFALEMLQLFAKGLHAIGALLGCFFLHRLFRPPVNTSSRGDPPHGKKNGRKSACWLILRPMIC